MHTLFALLLNWQSVPLPAPNTTTVTTVQAVPIRTLSTRRVFGRQQNVSLWKISACTQGSAITLASERLLMGTTIPFMPNALAEDIVGRQISTDPTTIIGKNGNAALTLATTLVTGVGIVAKSPNTLYASVAASVLQFIINAATAQAPNAGPYFSQLLPETLTFGAQGCGWWYAFSSLMKDPQVQVWNVK